MAGRSTARDGPIEKRVKRLVALGLILRSNDSYCGAATRPAIQHSWKYTFPRSLFRQTPLLNHGVRSPFAVCGDYTETEFVEFASRGGRMLSLSMHSVRLITRVYTRRSPEKFVWLGGCGARGNVEAMCPPAANNMHDARQRRGLIIRTSGIQSANINFVSYSHF